MPWTRKIVSAMFTPSDTESLGINCTESSRVDFLIWSTILKYVLSALTELDQWPELAQSTGGCTVRHNSLNTLK